MRSLTCFIIIYDKLRMMGRADNSPARAIFPSHDGRTAAGDHPLTIPELPPRELGGAPGRGASLALRAGARRIERAHGDGVARGGDGDLSAARAPARSPRGRA